MLENAEDVAISRVYVAPTIDDQEKENPSVVVAPDAGDVNVTGERSGVAVLNDAVDETELL